MKKKIIGIFICTLVMAATIVSAAGIMDIRSSEESVTDLNTNSIEIYSNRQLQTNEQHEENDTPQQLATKTGYLAVPPAAFIPDSTYWNYQNDGYRVFGVATLIAPVYILDGATITKLEYHWIDASPTFDGYLALMVNYNTGWAEIMAECRTSGDSGHSMMTFDNTIDHATIDNFHQSYYLYTLTFDQVALYGVKIEYTYVTKGTSESMFENEKSLELNVPLSD